MVCASANLEHRSREQGTLWPIGDRVPPRLTQQEVMSGANAGAQRKQDPCCR